MEDPLHMEIQDDYDGEDRNSTKVGGAIKEGIDKLNSAALSETIASYSRNRQ